MVLITVSEELENILRQVARDEGIDEDLRLKLSRQLAAEPLGDVPPAPAGKDGSNRRLRALSPSTLARAIPHIRRLGLPGGGGVLELVRRGGKLIFPDARAVPFLQGEERRKYEERRLMLLQRQEQREYARMSMNIQRAPRETVRDIQESIKFQAGMGANTLLAVGSSFGIGYWAASYVKWNHPSKRMLIGLVAAVAMLIVELIVFVTRSLKADRVLEAAREEAERARTDVGVPRALSTQRPRRGGRGVLEGHGGSDASGVEMTPQGLSTDEDTEPLLPDPQARERGEASSCPTGRC